MICRILRIVDPYASVLCKEYDMVVYLPRDGISDSVNPHHTTQKYISVQFRMTRVGLFFSFSLPRNKPP